MWLDLLAALALLGMMGIGTMLGYRMAETHRLTPAKPEEIEPEFDEREAEDFLTLEPPWRKHT